MDDTYDRALAEHSREMTSELQCHNIGLLSTQV